MHHMSVLTLHCPRCGGTANIIDGKEYLMKRAKLIVKQEL